MCSPSTEYSDTSRLIALDLIGVRSGSLLRVETKTEGLRKLSLTHGTPGNVALRKISSCPGVSVSAKEASYL